MSNTHDDVTVERPPTQEEQSIAHAQKMRQCLQFYANQSNWEEIGAALYDSGSYARQTLELLFLPNCDEPLLKHDDEVTR